MRTIPITPEIDALVDSLVLAGYSRDSVFGDLISAVVDSRPAPLAIGDVLDGYYDLQGREFLPELVVHIYDDGSYRYVEVGHEHVFDSDDVWDRRRHSDGARVGYYAWAEML